MYVCKEVVSAYSSAELKYIVGVYCIEVYPVMNSSQKNRQQKSAIGSLKLCAPGETKNIMNYSNAQICLAFDKPWQELIFQH